MLLSIFLLYISYVTAMFKGKKVEGFVITTKGVGVMSEKKWTGTPRLMKTAAARLAKRLLLPPLGGWARAS